MRLPINPAPRRPIESSGVALRRSCTDSFQPMCFGLLRFCETLRGKSGAFDRRMLATCQRRLDKAAFERIALAAIECEHAVIS